MESYTAGQSCSVFDGRPKASLKIDSENPAMLCCMLGKAELHRMLIGMVLVSHMYPPPHWNGVGLTHVSSSSLEWCWSHTCILLLIGTVLVVWPRVFLVQTYNCPTHPPRGNGTEAPGLVSVYSHFVADADAGDIVDQTV